MKFERRSWTPAERDRVLSGAIANESTVDICKAVNRTPFAVDSVIHTLRRQGHNIAPRYKASRHYEIVREIPARKIADKINEFWGKQVAWVDKGRLVTCLVGGKPVDSVRP